MQLYRMKALFGIALILIAVSNCRQVPITDQLVCIRTDSDLVAMFEDCGLDTDESYGDIVSTYVHKEKLEMCNSEVF